MEALQPVAANPYTLLSRLKPERNYLRVLGLKDAFLCLPLAAARQKWFAFEWENPDSGRKARLPWAAFPHTRGNKVSAKSEMVLPLIGT